MANEHTPENDVIRVHAFGMMHPSWRGPECFYYDTSEQAQAAIVKVYGPDTDHRVVERQFRVIPPANNKD
jgi:hypothetical protein